MAIMLLLSFVAFALIEGLDFQLEHVSVFWHDVLTGLFGSFLGNVLARCILEFQNEKI